MKTEKPNLSHTARRCKTKSAGVFGQTGVFLTPQTPLCIKNGELDFSNKALTISIKYSHQRGGRPASVSFLFYYNTLSGQRAIRFFGVKITAGCVVPVAGRQPGCLVRPAGCHFLFQKAPQNLSVSQNGGWKIRKVQCAFPPTFTKKTLPAPILAAGRRVVPCPLR